MALKNVITALSITNLVILSVIFETHSYNADDSYKTYYVNKYNRNNLDDQKDSSEQIAKKIAKYVAIEIKKPYDHDEQSLSEEDIEKINQQPRFIFPDQMLQARYGGNTRNPLMIPAINCGGQTFCENVSNYPQEFVDQLLLHNSTLRNFVTEDIMPIKTRVFSEEDPLCPFEERLIRPQSARNRQNETLFIIQSSEKNFFQTIRIETCQNENTECRLIDIPFGYAMMCKQKYIYRELWAVSKTGEAIRDYFSLPASCCCHSEFDPQLTQLRSGFRQKRLSFKTE